MREFQQKLVPSRIALQIDYQQASLSRPREVASMSQKARSFVQTSSKILGRQRVLVGQNSGLSVYLQPIRRKKVRRSVGWHVSLINFGPDVGNLVPISEFGSISEFGPDLRIRVDLGIRARSRNSGFYS